ncbi:MAG: carbohydrate ABC transporter permease [Chthonomonas sp.]|nr:carbohydrate ABC transporter permease [Chthonomonas sp.]
MPLIGQVGRKRWRARLAMSVIYLILAIGAVTTIYPFLVMISTGFTGPTDQNENRLVPSFWQDDEKLYAKYLDDKFSGNAGQIAAFTALTPKEPGDSKEYEDFMMALDPMLWTAGFRTAPTQVTSKLSLRYQAWLRSRFKSVKDLNEAYLEENVAFQTAQPPIEQLERPGWKPRPGRKWEEWLEFKKTLSVEYRIPILRSRQYQEYVRTKYRNQFQDVPREVRGSATTFEELHYDLRRNYADEIRREFMSSGVGPSADQHWNGESAMPLLAWDSNYVKENAGAIKQEFSSRNYRYVFDYVALNGRALWNTALFCLLAIIIQLLVNPIAAYAISRYPMPATGKILIFLLATMAFPAEVAMIPSFLLLKDLNLLNTFWALVLPGAASGYMIFLLKGFFDSLPQELFESGQMDGAPEWLMMLKIAFPLSRPVLGYLALLAFMGAYGAFLYAFLVAQDRNMWTLMVFIYQLQLTAPKAVMMAAVTLAALPTLIVFLLCQRVIMRGIVLPGER